MTVGAVLFDLDGTLVDSYEAIREGFSWALVRLGGRPVSLEETRRRVGHGLPQLIRQGLADQGLDVENLWRDGVKLFHRRYEEVVFTGTRLLPGVPATLANLLARGVKMGVASNKPAGFSRMIVEHYGLSCHLPVVLGPEDVPEPKPDPAMLLALAAALGVAPGECVYVGDMPIDVQTARAAGMRVFCIPSGGSSREDLVAAGPDVLLERFEDLPGLI